MTISRTGGKAHQGIVFFQGHRWPGYGLLKYFWTAIHSAILFIRSKRRLHKKIRVGHFVRCMKKRSQEGEKVFVNIFFYVSLKAESFLMSLSK